MALDKTPESSDPFQSQALFVLISPDDGQAIITYAASTGRLAVRINSPNQNWFFAVLPEEMRPVTFSDFKELYEIPSAIHNLDEWSTDKVALVLSAARMRFAEIKLDHDEPRQYRHGPMTIAIARSGWVAVDHPSGPFITFIPHKNGGINNENEGNPFHRKILTSDMLGRKEYFGNLWDLVFRNLCSASNATEFARRSVAVFAYYKAIQGIKNPHWPPPRGGLDAVISEELGQPDLFEEAPLQQGKGWGQTSPEGLPQRHVLSQTWDLYPSKKRGIV